MVLKVAHSGHSRPDRDTTWCKQQAEEGWEIMQINANESSAFKSLSPGPRNSTRRRRRGMSAVGFLNSGRKVWEREDELRWVRSRLGRVFRGWNSQQNLKSGLSLKVCFFRKVTNFLWRTPNGINHFLQIPRNEGDTLDCLVGPLEVRESDRTVRVAGTQQRGSQATQWQGLRVSHSRVLCVRQWPTSFHQLAFSYTSVCSHRRSER